MSTRENWSISRSGFAHFGIQSQRIKIMGAYDVYREGLAEDPSHSSTLFDLNLVVKISEIIRAANFIVIVSLTLLTMKTPCLAEAYDSKA